MTGDWKSHGRDTAASGDAQYRGILEEIEDGYYEVDLEGNIVFFNESLCRMLGYGPGELLGMNNRTFVDHVSARRVYPVFNRVLRTGRPHKGFRWEITGKDGTRLHVETSISLIRGPEGTPKGFRGICRDITRRVQAEEERRKLESRLHLARKMEAIGTLAGGVAHDLNNVLSGLVSYPELILMDLPADNPLRKPITAIRRSGERAAAIVQDLLAIARRGIPTREPMDIASLVSGALASPEIARIKAEHPGIDITVECEKDMLPVVGAVDQLSKSLVNLVINASASIQGAGTVTVTAGNVYLDSPINGYESVVEGEYVALRVADSGPGISSKDLERIFEPFYTKKFMGRGGTGLEMTVVLGTVQGHDGYITSESSPGKGSAFTLYLPATREEMEKTGGHDPRDYLGKGEQLVVVDDVDVQREIATHILTRLGYSVRSFASGEDAVEYMEHHAAHLMILDMIMDPGMDGLDTYREVLKHHPGQKAIVVSGYSETDRVRELRKLGVESYIKKPYLAERLGLAVRSELDR